MLPLCVLGARQADAGRRLTGSPSSDSVASLQWSTDWDRGPAGDACRLCALGHGEDRTGWTGRGLGVERRGPRSAAAAPGGGLQWAAGECASSTFS